MLRNCIAANAGRLNRSRSSLTMKAFVILKISHLQRDKEAYDLFLKFKRAAITILDIFLCYTNRAIGIRDIEADREKRITDMITLKV